MNEMQVSERKVLRGDVIERLYKNYGKDLRIAVLKNFLRASGWMGQREDSALIRRVCHRG